MGDSNTNQSTGNVEAVTALTNAATIRKLLRLPNEEGKTNFEILLLVMKVFLYLKMSVTLFAQKLFVVSILKKLQNLQVWK